MTVSQAINRTIQKFPSPQEGADGNYITLFLAAKNDIIEPWDGNSKLRDEQLAKFWKEEPFLASAIYSIAATRAALSWELTGPPKTVAKVQKILNAAQFREGWQNLMMLVNTDLLASDNGAFIEVIREPKTANRKPESMPILGLAHLPAIRCLRTGNPKWPVIYYDKDGGRHVLPWYRVITLAENPIPESRVGRQFCFVSRVLKFATIARDILQHNSEKVSGRFNKAIHVISGLAQGEIENINAKSQMLADNQGLTHYMEPIILTTLDPNARVTKETIELATLPDGFNFDELMTWYVTLIALASGSDYQEFAPLSSGNLGTASQSDTLHRKAQRKGTQLFIKLIETNLQHSKVVPDTVEFRFRQQDAQAEMEQAEIQKVLAQTRDIQIKNQEINPEVARQIAVDSNGLRQEYLLMLGTVDQTPTVTIGDDETVSDELLTPTITESTPVPLAIAQRAASYIVKQITTNPLNQVSPINNDQLGNFWTVLRNMLTKPTYIHTKGNWMSEVLVLAAIKAGIHTHALRYRIPNDLSLLVTHEGLANKDGWIYKYISKKTTTKSLEIDDMMVVFEKIWPETNKKFKVLRNVLMKAFLMGNQDRETTPEKITKVQLFIQKQMNLLVFTNDIELFKFAAYHLYYQALSETI